MPWCASDINKKKKKKKNGEKETELTKNIQEQAWRMKYLLTEIKWMNIKVLKKIMTL